MMDLFDIDIQMYIDNKNMMNIDMKNMKFFGNTRNYSYQCLLFQPTHPSIPNSSTSF